MQQIPPNSRQKNQKKNQLCWVSCSFREFAEPAVEVSTFNLTFPVHKTTALILDINMAEIAEVQVILNKAPEETRAPFPNPNTNGKSVPEHALSLTGALSAEDPTSLPSMDVKMVSEKFSDLKEEPKAGFEKENAKRHDSVSYLNNLKETSGEPSSPLTPPPPRPQEYQEKHMFTGQDTSAEGADLFHSSSLLTSLENQPTAAAAPLQQAAVAAPQPSPAFQPGPATPTKASPPPPPPPPPPSSLPATVGTPLQLPKQQQQAVSGTSAAWRTDAERAAKLARERDVAAAFAGLPRVKPQWTHNYMKILIVGDDGLGKTTFIRNLFAAYAANIDFPVADASGHGASTLFSDRPEQLCTELAVQDEDSMVFWHYLVQDTPGYGDFDGHEDARAQRKAIIDYIQNCSKHYLDLEVDISRRSSMQQIPDTRVDVVLYFLPPHRLRRSDIRFIKLLTQVGVPVVPILSKADSMTPEELHVYRHEVHAALHRHGIWHFSHEALSAAGAQHGPPFAVVGADTIDRSVGRFWPVRRYPWGKCESLLTAHSELPILRRLLFETAYWELKANTDKEYHKFRRTECGDRFHPVPRPVRGLLRLAGNIALAVGAVFIIVNATPLIRDKAVRRETVRRVKKNVGEAVESVADSVQNVGEHAEETAKTVKSVAEAAVETGKKQALKGAAFLETPQVREARETVNREVLAAQKPWWRFW
uniref:CDC10 cell division cycle 10 homolog n=1 Tax=Nannochloris bacillaris TaxID=76111 RepID=Q68BK2_NANBA|nr:CDC10 cell division cycle 10 homolog [Nannochloris bacillaris]